MPRFDRLLNTPVTSLCFLAFLQNECSDYHVNAKKLVVSISNPRSIIHLNCTLLDKHFLLEARKKN